MPSKSQNIFKSRHMTTTIIDVLHRVFIIRTKRDYFRNLDLVLKEVYETNYQYLRLRYLNKSGYLLEIGIRKSLGSIITYFD